MFSETEYCEMKRYFLGQGFDRELVNDEVLALSELERNIEKHDESIQAIFEAIRQLMTPPEKPRRIYPVKFRLASCF